jgi:hypothetical protein
VTAPSPAPSRRITSAGRGDEKGNVCSPRGEDEETTHGISESTSLVLNQTSPMMPFEATQSAAARGPVICSILELQDRSLYECR